MKFYETDAEFMERFQYFVEEEVEKKLDKDVDEKTKSLAILAALLGSQSLALFKDKVLEYVTETLTPVEIKELVYQAVDYAGFGKVYPFLQAVNEAFQEKEIALPLETQSTTTLKNRLEKGEAAQVEIFGAHMNDAWKSSTINYYLASNCFGDYYTRTGLNLKQREVVTFCILMAQGGCEPQVIAHAKGNMNLGNDAQFLENIVLECLPYIGYPRSLNALSCVNKAKE